ncbi:hypothetical protein IJZ97_05565 [bacterium]|nr:hypothetical protein [bacterium]
MASIKDAIEETIGETAALKKFLLYAIPIYITYWLFSIGNMSWCFTVGFFTILMLLTIFEKAFHNIRNEKNYILEPLNIFSYIYSSTKVLFAFGPMFGICYWIGIKLVSLEIPIPLPNIQLIYTIIVWTLLGSIVITSLLNYAKTEKVKDAYDIVLISNTCIDILLAAVFYIPQAAIVNILFLGIFAYVFGILWYLTNPVFIFLCCITLAFNMVVAGHYFAQFDYENFAQKD